MGAFASMYDSIEQIIAEKGIYTGLTVEPLCGR